MKSQPSFFDFAAAVGLTKHMGGVAATQALAELCQLRPGQRLLDVGCGVGVTPCYLAQAYSCRVVGVDIVAAMLVKSRERAQRQGALGQVAFVVADAQHLPFAPGQFDVVITESVTAFPPDKQGALNEYARVTRPGGRLGLNESTWLQTPVPPEMLAWVVQDQGANVAPLSADGWTGLMAAAGVEDIQVKTEQIDLRAESQGILQRYGLGGFLRILGRMLLLYARSPAYRAFVKSVGQGGLTPAHLQDYLGYGLYVGRKGAS